MNHFLLWIAVPLLLLGAAMLITGVGASGQWIVVIAVGIALVAVDRGKPSAAGPR